MCTTGGVAEVYPLVHDRLWRIGALVALLAVSGFAALIAVRSYTREITEFFPPRHPVTVPFVAAGLPGLEPVAFTDAGGATLRGWYVPSSNGAAVILLHGAGGDRSSMLPEARRLAQEGFGVLTFDLPGQGESDGETHWADGEGRALTAAVDFLSTRPEVDPTRLGALGFSLGGAVLARVAPDEPRLKAVVLAGTPSDQVEQVNLEYGQWGPLSRLPALWALQQGGVPLHDDQPVQQVAEIAPRPVLIVSGSSDTTVPEALARDLFAAARDPKELLVVDGAGHGNYDQAPASPYLDTVARFFDRTLLNNSQLSAT
jgi:alpha-beta hydrolase superfamily lysophospholipase